MSGLPAGWIWAQGADVFELVTSGSRGWAKHYAPEGAAFLRVGNLDHDTIKIDLTEMQRVVPPAGAEGERTRLQPNDLLISITAELCMVGLVPAAIGEAYINQHLALARPRLGLDPRFLAWYFASKANGKAGLLALGRGGTKAGLGLGDVREVPVAVAPLAEQQRIADKLDAIFARVDACRARLDRVGPLLQRFRRSVLAAATMGGLIEGSGDCSEVSVGDIASGFSYGSAAKSSAAGSVPVLRMGNIQRGALDWTDLVFTSDEDEIAKYRLVPGDLLFNRTNSPELVGKSAVYRGDREAIYAGYLIRVQCGESVLPDYLHYCLSSPAGRAYCWQVKSDGVSQSNINAKKLAAFRFLLPSREDQRSIVAKVQRLFAVADALESRLRNAQSAVTRATPALLAKAFRGELVPQDPIDDPAAEMLAHLKASQPTQTAGKRRRDTV